MGIHKSLNMLFKKLLPQIPSDYVVIVLFKEDARRAFWRDMENTYAEECCVKQLAEQGVGEYDPEDFWYPIPMA